MNINIENKKYVKEQVEALQTYLAHRFTEADDKRSKRSKRFTEGYEFYEGLAPAHLEGEVVKTVVPVVRSVVDRLQPSLMNIFTENEAQAVVFRPQRSMLPKEVIEAVNLKVNDIFLRQNDGYNVLANAFREALVTGDAFMKTFVESETIEEEVDFGEEGVPGEMFALALQDFPDTDLDKVDIFDKTIKDEFTGTKTKVPMVRGKVTLTRIERTPRAVFVPFDEMFALGDTVDIDESRYVCHRIKKTVGELIEMGFDKDVVMSAQVAISTDSVSTAELSDTGAFTSEDDEDASRFDPMEKSVHLYEHYIYTSLLDKKGKSKLYQVFAVNTDKVLEINEVERIPFVHGVPDRIPGSFWGKGAGEMFGGEQILMTSLLRDYAQLSKRKANPSFVVVKGQYNQQSLLNCNRPGSVVEVNQPGAVTPVDFSGQVNDLLGVLNYVQGQTQEGMMNTVGAQVDPAAMANMSATGVAVQVHNTEMKDKRIAKSLAYTLIRPLFEMLYHMIKEEGLPLEVEGMVPSETGEMVPQVVPFDSNMLPSRTEFYIDVNTSSDDAKQINTLSSVAATLAQLGAMPSQVMTPANLYNIGARMLKSADITDVDSYLTDPSTQQPSPEEQQLAMAQAEEDRMRAADMAEAQLGNVAAQQNLVETQAEELVKMNNWTRELDEKKLLVEMEKLEIARGKEEAKAEQDAIRNGLRAEELAIEAELGVQVGIS